MAEVVWFDGMGTSDPGHGHAVPSQDAQSPSGVLWAHCLFLKTFSFSGRPSVTATSKISIPCPMPPLCLPASSPLLTLTVCSAVLLVTSVFLACFPFRCSACLLLCGCVCPKAWVLQDVVSHPVPCLDTCAISEPCCSKPKSPAWVATVQELRGPWLKLA